MNEKNLALSLLDDGAACVAVRGSEILGSESGKGLRPLYRLTQALGDALEGAFVADLVLGKAAALLLGAAKVRACYGRLVSDGAVQVLSAAGIGVEWDQRVPHILAADQRGWCPMERLAFSSFDDEEALSRLRRVLGGEVPLSEYVTQ